MSFLSKKKKIKKEMIYGGVILSFYIIWGLYWFIQSYFLKGQISSPYIPQANIELELIPPFEEFIIGTDVYGRSLFEVISMGLNYSILISFIVCFCSASIGIIVGYFSTSSNQFVQKFFDLLTNLIFIFPSILIAIMVMSFTGQSLWGLSLVLIFTGWPGYARVARGEIQRVLGLSYVESAKAIGMNQFRLFAGVILTSILPQMLVHFVLGISGVIVSEATLGFLGLGGSEYSWGALLSMGKGVLLEGPHIVIFISIVMAFLIIGLNLFGDGLRDYLDPKDL